ncbi:ATP-binding protein [Rheinheimera texasensis]|uniref:sensor histidine kinase n=1 Tax=Rheinheimera texasensis TaxID=306205 RepID=UPI0032B1C471
MLTSPQAVLKKTPAPALSMSPLAVSPGLAPVAAPVVMADAERQELQRLQHLLQVLPNGIVVLDQRGYVMQANPVAVAMLGEPLHGQRWLDVINRSFRPRNDDGLEVSLHDGRRVQLAISPLEPLAGQLIVLTDLTETRQLQSRLSHLQRLSSLGKMMASLAHQIRTPLSGALLYARNLRNQKLEPAAREQFSQKLLNRLTDLEQQVNDLLLFARAGREQQAQPLSMQQLLSEVFAAVEPLVLQQQGTVLVELPDPDVMVLGNHTALAGALSNLVHNALEHAGPGARIQLSAIASADERQVVLAVEDEGPGVPEHLRQQIFEPFYTTRSNGTGLGLAVVQAVATSHSGLARCLQSAAGGARFELVLPVCPATVGTPYGGASSIKEFSHA